MSNPHKKDKGQAIVLIALAMVALIAFAGLAIDGGMVYADRRHAQNASDAGSLAGGGAAAMTLEDETIDYKNFECPPLNDDGTYGAGANSNEIAVKTALDAAEAAAIDQMEDNEYTLADFSVLTFCHESLSNNFKNYIDITTTITKETELTFIQIVYDGPAINRVDAVTRVTPREAFAFGNAIVALNPLEDEDCDNASSGGIKFAGTGVVSIDGGGAFSNGCLVAKGTCNIQMEYSEYPEGEEFPGIGYFGGNFGECPVMTPEPMESGERLPEDSYIIPTPDCSECEEEDAKSICVNDITIHNNEDVDLNEEFYGKTLICLESSGNALKMTGGTLMGDGYTIFAMNYGDIDITGGVVTLTAPIEADDPAPAIPGVIFYANYDDDDTNNPDSIINIEGNQSSEYLGAIYGPAADIKITGTSAFGPTFNTQIIGWNVTLLGTANFEINFSDDWVAKQSTRLNLQK